MSRAEFTKQTKRAALRRSEQRCEAIGTMYRLPSYKRCGVSLAYGVEFDHIVLAANGGDNSLENCAAVCKRCHKIKTTKHDTPMAAKTVRLQDRARGIKSRPSRPIPGSKASGWRKPFNGPPERRY